MLSAPPHLSLLTHWGQGIRSYPLGDACSLMAAASAILRQLPRIKSHRRRLLNLVESLNYVGIIAAVLASGGTIQKAIEISASDASCAYNRRLRGALILRATEWHQSMPSSAHSASILSSKTCCLSYQRPRASDPKQLIVAWRRESRSATSMVEDISSIFTALSSILPIISSIIIAILGRDASLFFVILPLQLLIYGVIRWWLRNGDHNDYAEAPGSSRDAADHSARLGISGAADYLVVVLLAAAFFASLNHALAQKGISL